MFSAAEADRVRGTAIWLPHGEAREREGGGVLQGLQRQARRRGRLVPQQRTLQPRQRYTIHHKIIERKNGKQR